MKPHQCPYWWQILIQVKEAQLLLLSKSIKHTILYNLRPIFVFHIGIFDNPYAIFDNVLQVVGGFKYGTARNV